MVYGKKKYIAGLDIGTSKVCAAIGRVNADGAVEILGIGAAAARGWTNGAVTELSLAGQSVDEAVALAEERSGVSVSRVFAALTSPEVKIIRAVGQAAIADRESEIARKDAQRACAYARDTALPLERKAIYVENLGYSVDEQKGVKDPVGLYGTKLSVELNMITAPHSLIQNLDKAVHAAGLEVEAMCPASIAAALSVFTDDEKEEGVILLDIGKGICELSVYREGAIRELHTLTLGAGNIVEELAANLKISPSDAEELMGDYVVFPASAISPDEKIALRTSYGERSIPRREICLLAEKKLSEIFFAIKERMNTSEFGHPACGIVLTGGLSMIEGVVELCQVLLGVHVRLGYSRDVLGNLKNVTNPAYAVAIGLLRYAAQRDKVLGAAKPDFVSRLLSRAKEFYEEYF